MYLEEFKQKTGEKFDRLIEQAKIIEEGIADLEKEMPALAHHYFPWLKPKDENKKL